MSEHDHCKMCGRYLGKKKNRERGFGPTCWKKRQAYQHEVAEKAGQLRLAGV